MISLVKKSTMKIYQLSLSSLLILGLMACGGSEEDHETAGDAIENVINVVGDVELNQTVQTDGEFCNITIPNSMEEMEELNPLASIKYGSVEKSGGEVLENYIIVIPETYEEIAAYEFEFEFDLASYNDVCVEGMTDGLVNYEVLSDGPEVEEVNGMEVIITELQGGIDVGEAGIIEIYYLMGVFKGENAYYQVLSWTLKDQKSRFKKDMEKMIRSFEEI